MEMIDPESVTQIMSGFEAKRRPSSDSSWKLVNGRYELKIGPSGKLVVDLRPNEGILINYVHHLGRLGGYQIVLTRKGEFDTTQFNSNIAGIENPFRIGDVFKEIVLLAGSIRVRE
ncbi:MAG TPA: hypothetical protein VLH19_02500 [Patescibacteria group bacterium]|nr:hypothetical protein [Patescibacteria group bacterium]